MTEDELEYLEFLAMVIDDLVNREQVLRLVTCFAADSPTTHGPVTVTPDTGSTWRI